MKRIVKVVFGLIITVLIWPFKTLLINKMEKIKNSYIKDPKSFPDDKAYFILKDLAWKEYDDGNSVKAKEYAEELMRLNNVVERNWNYGNAIHYSHLILGLICLDEGKIDGAKNHLIKSSKMSGSPQLNTFGPNFKLAQRLIKKGEKKVVIIFLKRCKKFWPEDNGKISKWLSEIERDKIPQMIVDKTI